MKIPFWLSWLLGVSVLAALFQVLTPERANCEPVTQETEGEFNLVQTIFLSNVRVEGSSVLSQAEIDKITAPYRNREVTIEDLIEIGQKLTQYYIDKGYVSSHVVLPTKQIFQQNVNPAQATVIYQAVEGEIEAINVEGIQGLTESYVYERLAQFAVLPVNVEQLQEGLLLFKEDPLIEEIRGDLAAGSAPGKSQWNIQIKEAPPWNIGVEGSNDENPLVGSWGWRASLENRNLFGNGELFRTEFKQTAGLERFLVTTIIPVSPRDDIQASYQLLNSKIVLEELEPAGIRNDSFIVGVNYNHILSESLNETFQIGFSVDYRENQSYLFEDIPFSFEQNVENGLTQTTTFRTNQTYRQRTLDSALLLNSTFSFGWTNLTDTSNFLSWQGQLIWLKQLGQDTQWWVRLGGQGSPNNLPAQENCAIGGINGNVFVYGNIIRAYGTNIRSGDNCLAISTELVFTLTRQDWGSVDLVAPFLDFGTVWQNEGQELEPNALASTGFGLRLYLGDVFSLRVDYGIPLIATEQKFERQEWSVSGLLKMKF